MRGDIVSTGNLDRVEEFIAPGHVEIHEGKRHPLGIGGVVAHVRGVRRCGQLAGPLLEIGALRVVGEKG